MKEGWNKGREGRTQGGRMVGRSMYVIACVIVNHSTRLLAYWDYLSQVTFFTIDSKVIYVKKINIKHSG